MKRFLMACSLAAIFAATGGALAQSGSMSAPDTQGGMSQSATGGQMSSGQMSSGQMSSSQMASGHMAGQTMKKKKPHASKTDSMSGGSMNSPASGTMGSQQPANNSDSMSSPH